MALEGVSQAEALTKGDAADAAVARKNAMSAALVAMVVNERIVGLLLLAGCFSEEENRKMKGRNTLVAHLFDLLT